MKNFFPDQNNRLIESLCRRYGIELLILFGSEASGTGHTGSDTDIAVKPDIDKQISKLNLIQDLETIFQDQQIDLTVITPNTDPLLLFEIFFNGRPFYENVPGIFEKNRLKAWHLYLDTMPLRKLEKLYNEVRIRELGDVT